MTGLKPCATDMGSALPRANERASGLCHNLPVLKDRLATADRPDDHAAELKADIGAYFMALEQVRRFQRIRTRRVDEQEIGVVSQRQRTF